MPKSPKKTTVSQSSDRIKELRRVRAGDICPNPKNWRTHPESQRDAVAAVIAEIGYADALIARELPDGRLELIDGHLRRDLDPEQMVPVLVLDVTEAEADKLLLTLDPLAELAGADQQLLDDLLRSPAAQTSSQALADMITDLAQEHDLIPTDGQLASDDSAAEPAPDQPVPEKFQLIITLPDEAAQRQLYEQLDQEGFDVRVLTI